MEIISRSLYSTCSQLQMLKTVHLLPQLEKSESHPMKARKFASHISTFINGTGIYRTYYYQKCHIQFSCAYHIMY